MEPAVVVIEQAAETETLRGSIIEGGITCPQMKLTDGRVVSLQGIGRKDAIPGMHLEVSGQFVMMSTCQQGQTFHVFQILK